MPVPMRLVLAATSIALAVTLAVTIQRVHYMSLDHAVADLGSTVPLRLIDFCYRLK